MKHKIFEKEYKGFESISDAGRDIEECFDARFNPEAKVLPGEFRGTVVITVTYIPPQTAEEVIEKIFKEKDEKHKDYKDKSLYTPDVLRAAKRLKKKEERRYMMDRRYEARLCCDVKDCCGESAYIHLKAATPISTKSLLKEAKKLGWSITAKRHYCPNPSHYYPNRPQDKK